MLVKKVLIAIACGVFGTLGGLIVTWAWEHYGADDKLDTLVEVVSDRLSRPSE
jgi:hypothetical protein